jgi:PhzF family phenazine biosynthesis protein
MPTFPIYQVDAFTQHRFQGNPAAVVLLETWLPEATMQAIALENNLAETAYIVRRPDGSYDVRWFTPELEIPLCGHATLASAYVLYAYLGFSGEKILFHSKSGELTVEKSGDKLTLNFPARPLHALPPAKHTALIALLTNVLGRPPVELYHSVNNYLAVYQTEADVRAIKPNFMLLNELPDVIGVIVTTQGEANTDYDCVSRYFCPNAGIPEDPVTGSAHCSIVPYWASARGGELFCEYCKQESGNRVIMAGYVAPYMKGEITI